MRGYVPQYEVKKFADLTETLRAFQSDPSLWKPLAGGTDLMVLLETGTLNTKNWISIGHLKELQGIQETPDRVILGALTTFTDIQRHALLQKEFPALIQAARSMGALAIQNRATLGGNIANASPAADAPPALLIYNAEIQLVSAQNSRWIPYSEFHTGYKQTQLKPGELIQAIALPRLPNQGTQENHQHYYRKVGTRKAQAISKVCFAGLLQHSPQEVYTKVRIAVGSVAATTLRCTKTEAFLLGKKRNTATLKKARELFSQEICPIGDIRSSAEYRLEVAGNLLEEFLNGSSAAK